MHELHENQITRLRSVKAFIVEFYGEISLIKKSGQVKGASQRIVFRGLEL